LFDDAVAFDFGGFSTPLPSGILDTNRNDVETTERLEADTVESV
jgi:hypothetical protein